MPTITDPDADERYAPKVGGGHENTGVHPEHAEAQVADLEKQFADESAPEATYGKSATGSELKTGEENTADDTVGGGFKKENKKHRKFKWITKKRAGIAGGVAGVGLSGGLLGLSILQAPFQFIHAGQILQQLHFSSNENSGDSRSSKALLYALAGLGAERSRLGIVGNKAADKWEAKLLKETGLRPVYSSTTRRLVGFEISDGNKLHDSIGDVNADNFGKGSRVTSASQASEGRQGLVGSKNRKIPGNAEIVNLRNVSAKDRRIATRSIGRKTGVNKLASTLASRLLIKRGGVDFHPLKNIRRNKTDNAADYGSKRREARAKEASTGVDTNSTSAETKKDDKGNVTNQDSVNASGDANKIIDEAAAAPSKEAVKNIAKKVGKGGLAIGILCAVRGFGNDVPKYKYTHNVLPMLRMGMSVITTANQVMSGQGLNQDELGALNQQFYDSQSKTSFFDAKSIHSSYSGGNGGVDIPKEAQLGKLDDKPLFFQIMDNIPGLGSACGVLDSVSTIPIIGDIAGAVSSLATGAIDTVLSPFDISLEGLMQGALSIAAGKGVDTLASGGEYGALADTGAFLAANDNAMSMGGVALTNIQTAELNVDSQTQLKLNKQSESIASRYLNPYDYSSLVGMTIDHMPRSITQIADTLSSPAQMLQSGLSTLGTIFKPKAYATAIQPYDYGVPAFGFSLADQNDPRFENPYDNAQIVEPQLPALNDKYGKCFGMTASADESGVHLTSASAGDNNLNQFKIAKDGDCTSASEDLLRYRFYLADAVAVSSLDCAQDDDQQSCENVGITDSSTAVTTEPPSGTVSGDAATLAKQILANTNITLGPTAKSDLEATVMGQKVTPGQPASGGGGTGSCTARTPVYIDATLLQAALNIAKNYKIEIRDFTSGHNCDTGRHTLGRAFDIFNVNGTSITYSGANARLDSKFTTDVLDIMSKLLPDGKFVNGRPINMAGVGACSSGSPVDHPSNVNYFRIPDECDELHVDVGFAP